MVKIYRSVNGQTIERFMAGHPMVNAAIRTHAIKSRNRGRTLLAAHAHAGHSYVTAERDNATDWTVTLNDPSGPDPAGKYPIWMGAWNIEFGRGSNTDSPWGPMEGLFILHRAVGLMYGRGGKARVRVPGSRLVGHIDYTYKG